MRKLSRGPSEDRPGSKDIKLLLGLWRFVRPYRLQVLGATVALTVAAGTVLALGFGVRKLVDDGFASGDAGLLDGAVMVLFGVILLLSPGELCPVFSGFLDRGAGRGRYSRRGIRPGKSRSRRPITR